MSDHPSDYREIAEFYDAENAAVEFLGLDVEFFLAALGDEPRRVIELGCGTGRATREIAAAGHAVTGLDIDPLMLDLARSRGDGDVTYAQADLGVPGWSDGLGEGRYDAACCFFNTFYALARPEQQEACLRDVHRVLAPGGELWLDVFNPNLDLIAGSVDGETDLEPHLFRTDDGRSVMSTTSVRADIVRQVQHVTFHYVWFDRDGQRRERERTFELAWVTPRELERLLRLCGFRVEQIWGDYDGGPLYDDSERQIVQAVRTL